MTVKTRLGLVVLLIGSLPARADEPARLPGTEPLTWSDDVSVRMMNGLHTFIERKIDRSVEQRARYWKRDFTSYAADEQSVRPNRERLRKILGVVDPRVPVRMERFGDVFPRGRALGDRWGNDDMSLVAKADGYHVYQVRWPVLDGVTGEGLLFVPADRPGAHVIVLPDADQTPEQLVGLAPGVAGRLQFARGLAQSGFEVVVPVLIDRQDTWSGNAAVAWTNQPHREWIYRQAYHMGRHVIGYEVQKVSAVVDWFRQRDAKAKVGVAGYGEGGLVAFYAAAVDPRIDACLVSGYFGPRQHTWEEPLYRNVWSLLREFGDAEVATLIAPRSLVVEYSAVPKVDGPPPVRPGRRGGAAVGRLTRQSFDAVEDEFKRIGTLLPEGFQSRYLLSGPDKTLTGPGSEEALHKFRRLLGVPGSARVSDVAPKDERRHFDPAARQKRQVEELERHVQRLVRAADATRDRFFLSKVAAEPRNLARFTEQTPAYRRYLWQEVLGKFDDPPLPPRPRSRKVYDRPKWVGYEVVLDIFPDVFAWGILLLPRDLKPGERRPVVVCQHGRNGVPRDTIEGDNRAYHDFAARLADRGFIVFAPHNPYRGEDRYRILSRKANTVGASLFSFILAQHEQILTWLASLPQVDPERIAFYGLSYGGETAVRVPPLLSRYCLSICSADFNDWARKVASTDSKYSFMFTNEWEMPYFDMGGTFNYAEMAALMVPRPFMVERGHEDGVAPDEWVAYEYAKVRRLYDQLGLGDRTAIEFFDGPHTIHGVGTFAFLHRQLRWPMPH